MPRQATSNSNEETNLLKETLVNLQSLVESQQARIEELEKEREENSGPVLRRNSNPLSALKYPPIPIFTGTVTEGTSMKIKAFISSVSRVAKLSNNSNEDKMVQLTICHLQDRASTCITRLESKGEMSSSIEELKEAMINEFAPSNETARAQFKLLTLNMQNNLDKHIEDFIDLIETCDTPTRQSYSFFFMSLPKNLKGKFAEQFSEPNPADIREIFKYVRKFEIAEKWASGKQEDKIGRKSSNSGYDIPQGGQGKGVKGAKTPRKLDDSSYSWGPAKVGEGKTYREKNRCCKCGKNSWRTTCKINPCTKETLKAQKNYSTAL